MVLKWYHMPNINLRLSEEQHEQLRIWAFEQERSIQKEIIYRLFNGGLSERDGAAETAVASVAPKGVQGRGRTPIGSNPASDASRSESYVDPQWCGMANRHRTRTKANPCPRCGYPT